MRFIIQSLDKKSISTKTQPYEGREIPPPETYTTQNRHYKLFKYAQGKIAKDPIAEYHEYTPTKAHIPTKQ